MKKITRDLIETAVKEINLECCGYKVIIGSDKVFKIDTETDDVYTYDNALEFLNYLLKDWFGYESFEALIIGQDHYTGLDFYNDLQERYYVKFQIEQEIARLKLEGDVK